MTIEDGILVLKDIIQKQLRHKNYDRTVKLAGEYKAFITGDGIEDFLLQFKRREDEIAFKQRKDITVHINETICANLIDPQFKLPRSNSMERTLFYSEPDNNKLDELTSIISQFCSRDNERLSVEDFMANKWISYNNIDPNTFVSIDWHTNKNGERIKPYPVEYFSENVLHMNRKNGKLKWVCVYRPEDGHDAEKYLLFAENFTLIFERKKEFEWPEMKADILFYKEFPLQDFEGPVAVLKNRDDFYDIYVPKPHELGFVPGFFVGFIEDLNTNASYLGMLHKAVPILRKIVKVNSELDISMSFHAFPQKIQYAPPCPECNGSRRVVSGEVCTHCKGAGTDPKSTATTGQDIVEVPRPRDKEDFIDLSKLVYYVPNDVRSLKFLDEFIDKYTKKCKEAVYNSEVFSRKDVAETAYSKDVDLQNVYDALWPMAKAYASKYNFIVEAIAQITQLNKNLVHHLSFRKDFKMKSLSQLYEDLRTVGTSQAEEFVKAGIEEDIAQIQYEDDPRAYLKYKTMRHFFPFSGKTKDEIKLIMALPKAAKEEVRVLYANFSYIFDDLEMEFQKKNIDFYRIPREEQHKAVSEKVKSIIAEIKAQEGDIELNLQGA